MGAKADVKLAYKADKMPGIGAEKGLPEGGRPGYLYSFKYASFYLSPFFPTFKPV